MACWVAWCAPADALSKGHHQLAKCLQRGRASCRKETVKAKACLNYAYTHYQAFASWTNSENRSEHNILYCYTSTNAPLHFPQVSLGHLRS